MDKICIDFEKKIMKKTPQLTAKLKKYLDGRVKGLSADSAAKEAGYANASSAKTMANRTGLAEAYLKEQQEVMKKESDVSRKKLIDRLMEVIDDRSESTPSVIRAIDSVAKMCGLSEPEKVEVRHQPIVYELDDQIQMAKDILMDHGYEVIKKKRA